MRSGGSKKGSPVTGWRERCRVLSDTWSPRPARASSVTGLHRCRRARRSGARVTIAVDSEETIDAAVAGGVDEVLIDVMVGMPRCGCAPDDAARLADHARAAGLTVREAIRQKGTPYDELGLSDPALTDDQLLDAMLAHPILTNRPFVVGPRGTRLARPSEVVLEVLANPVAEFTKENGEVVRRPAQGLGKGSAHG